MRQSIAPCAVGAAAISNFAALPLALMRLLCKHDAATTSKTQQARPAVRAGINRGTPMPIVKADRLTYIGAALLKAARASDEEAHAVAVGCVNANLAGHDSHGIIAIPTYIDRLNPGHIVPAAPWTTLQQSPTTPLTHVPS